MSPSKAQVNIIEFLIASSMIIILLIAVISFSIYYEKKIDEDVAYNNLLVKAFQLSDIMSKSQGVPSGWNKNNVQVIGLALENRIISKGKLDMFVDMSEAQVKSRFKTNYDFYFSMKRVNGSLITFLGSQPAGIRSVVIDRYVFYENEEAIMELALWE